MKRGRPEALSSDQRRELYDLFVRAYPFWFDVLRLVPLFSGRGTRRDLWDTASRLSSFAPFSGREKEAAKQVLADVITDDARLVRYKRSMGRTSPRYLAFRQAASTLKVPLVGVRQMERYIAPFRTAGDTEVQLEPLPSMPLSFEGDS
jgi:hypothetical protein